MKTIFQMKNAKRVILVLCVFTPILVVAYAVFAIPNMQALRDIGGIDWMWLIFLAAMILGLYYFLAVYLKEEGDATAEFKRLDRDNDGYISIQDAENWPDLRRLFEKFDGDHDGRMSRADFEAFQLSIFSH